MAYVEVYNPKATPVIYGDGRTIGGLEWHTVEEDDVADLLADKRLITPKRATVTETVEEPAVEIQEEISIDDSSEAETDVSSDLVNENDFAEESVQDAPSDAPPVAEEPATIRKSRRRKRTTTERE